VLSAEQRLAFDETGVVHLPAAIAQAATQAMRAVLWRELERTRGMREGDPGSWRESRPAGLQRLAKRGAFGAMASPALREALDAVFAPDGWDEPPCWGQPLLCFPQRAAWDVPHLAWHLDFPGTPEHSFPAVRVFALLSDVAPGGGGTVVVAGSHRLVERLARRAGAPLRSAEARAQLATEHPWLAALAERDGADRAQRFLRDGATVCGVRLRVLELCGRSGDVVLMRADALHAAAPNAGTSPKLVVAQFVTRSRGG
jgi:hypothetical protein